MPAGLVTIGDDVVNYEEPYTKQNWVDANREFSVSYQIWTNTEQKPARLCKIDTVRGKENTAENARAVDDGFVAMAYDLMDRGLYVDRQHPDGRTGRRAGRERHAISDRIKGRQCAGLPRPDHLHQDLLRRQCGAVDVGGRGREQALHRKVRRRGRRLTAPGGTDMNMNQQPDTSQVDGYVTADGRQIGAVIMDIRNIVLRFGGVTAIKDVSFDIRKGEIRAIIGPNGAGKSSMLNVINGFYHPQEGEIWFKGKKRPSMKPYEVAEQGIARTFQNIALFKGMSTLDNIMTGRQLKMKRSFLWQCLRYGPAIQEEVEHREKVEEIIDFLEIQAIRKTPVGALPYGMQKRVELARALAMEPELLLLDEPMAGMNVEEKEDMSRFVIDVNEQYGTTICLIEHDMGVVMDLADRVVVLDYGRQLADDVPEVVQKDQAVIDAYLGV